VTASCESAKAAAAAADEFVCADVGPLLVVKAFEAEGYGGMLAGTFSAKSCEAGKISTGGKEGHPLFIISSKGRWIFGGSTKAPEFASKGDSSVGVPGSDTTVPDWYLRDELLDF
jgi:hypothetical protein